jgi:hypothetical protein
VSSYYATSEDGAFTTEVRLLHMEISSALIDTADIAWLAPFSYYNNLSLRRMGTQMALFRHLYSGEMCQAYNVVNACIIRPLLSKKLTSNPSDCDTVPEGELFKRFLGYKCHLALVPPSTKHPNCVLLPQYLRNGRETQ